MTRVTPRRCRRVAILLSLLLAAEVAAQQPLSPPGNTGVLTDRGLLAWQGDRPLTLPDIAALVAPVLWFSPDEPLLLNGGRIPHRHPCDLNGDQPVVYYQARRIRLAGEPRISVPAHEDPGFFDKVDAVAIRFYFYYNHDFGVGSHPHDLELVEMEVALGRTGNSQRELRIRKIVGFAHGTDWYSNELHVEADTRLPITVLVEEGKHASSPDRNADGIYTPGYDVNRRINDAWGVRDVLGSGFLTASAFQASMAKPRRPMDRVAPPAVTDALPASVLPSHDRRDPALQRYALRPAWSVPVCAPAGPEPERLRSMMRAHRFGPEYPADQYQFELLQDLAEPLTGTRSLVPALGARWDRRLGMTAELRGADLREVYLVPKINWVGRDLGVEALFTRSAAQWQSTYASIGFAREHLPELDGTSAPTLNATTEVGLKFRTRFEGRQRLFSLGYQFAGVRLGIRYSGFKTVKVTRMIVEIGPGVW